MLASATTKPWEKQRLRAGSLPLCFVGPGGLRLHKTRELHLGEWKDFVCQKLEQAGRPADAPAFAEARRRRWPRAPSELLYHVRVATLETSGKKRKDAASSDGMAVCMF